MTSWIACSTFLILSLSLTILCLWPSKSYSQAIYSLSESYSQKHTDNYYLSADTTSKLGSNGLPEPKSVMFKSMMVPGWGQIINKQIWKVPIVYGLLGGLGWYSVKVNKQYHDYRAAYYNLNPNNKKNDFKYGPTPNYISENANVKQLRSQRNTFHNRRDLIYVGIFLAYGLNIVDALVFAHLRSFDVSDNLSLRTNISPTMTAQATPGFSLKIDFITN